VGLFSDINNTLKKSEAAVVVQDLLEQQVKSGLFTLAAAPFANQLVQKIWQYKSEMLDGSQGPRPHKITVAAMALSAGVLLMDQGDLNRNGLILALGNLLDDVQRNGGLYSFNGLDHALLGSAASTFQQVAAELDGDVPLGA
jgi:hypothetical protein